MSPLALYIEKVYDHDAVSPGPNPNVVLYPPSPPDNRIFDSLRSAPILTKTEVNQIIVYPGSFNPPHRGHLHLLKHVFTRGTHDLNVIAAIILPRSDESVRRKVDVEKGLFRFGRDERCFLWKQDVCFPPWAWVYEKSTDSFEGFLERLIQATQKDGYSIEISMLYGAGIGSPDNPPNPVFGCKTIIISDVARAADFECSSDGIENFVGCTKWVKASINETKLWRRAKVEMNEAILGLKICVPTREVQKDGMFGSSSFPLDDSGLRRPFIGSMIVVHPMEAAVAQAIEDLKAVATCQRYVNGQTLNLRFVQCVKNGRKKFNDISSSDIRQIMHRRDGAKLKAALNWMALSAEVLWAHQNFWIDKARLGKGALVTFLDHTEDFVISEGSSSDTVTTPSETAPTFEELGLVKVVAESPAIPEQPPTSTSPISNAPSLTNPPPNLSPSFEKSEPQSPNDPEPQPPNEPQDPNDKTQRSSEAGLEAIEKSPSISEQRPASPPPISKPPSLTGPTPPNPSPSEDSEPQSPNDDQPQPPTEPQNPSRRKRRFSQTGFEDEHEDLNT